MLSDIEKINKLNLAKSNIDEVISSLGIPSSDLPKPSRDTNPTLANADGDVLLMPYSPVIFDSGRFQMFYRGWDLNLSCFSNTGLPGSWISANVTPTNANYGAVAKLNGVYFNSWHSWESGMARTHFAKSTNGTFYTEYSTSHPILAGEDRSLFFKEDIGMLYCYIRTRPKPREIGLMTSGIGIDWTSIVPVIPFVQADFDNPSSPDFRKQFYSMQVSKFGSNYWGLLNVLRLGNNGQDTEQLDPAGDEQTVSVQLCHSLDGITWTRCNSRKDFIDRQAGVMQQYATGTVVNDELWIYLFESARRHTDQENYILATSKKYFSIRRYKISKTDLEKYKPV